MNSWECKGRSPLQECRISLIGSSASLGARAVERGREGLYGILSGGQVGPWAGGNSHRATIKALPASTQLPSPLLNPGLDLERRWQDEFQVPQSAKRIALYWHNGRSLGHTVRCATLGQAFLDHLPGSIVAGITGASKGFELLPPAMDLVKIPSYLSFDDTVGISADPVLSLKKEHFQRIRENLISTFVRDFQPHALVVDFHPEGKNGELIPTVINSPNTQKVLGLRGILGNPTETNREFFHPRLVHFIQDHFSAIHVYVDEHVIRLEDYYAIPASLNALFKYTGYVTRPAPSTSEEARALLQLDADARIVVVSFGGGQGTEPIWQSILRSLSTVQKHFDFAYLSAGPYLEAGAYERLRRQVSQHPNWTWTSLLNPLPAWIKASNFFIGSGGYNSLTEIISTGANALIIPRQLNEREQELHATKLASLNVFRIARLETILSEDLTSLLEVCLKEPYPHNRKRMIATNGAQQSARLIEELIV